MTRPGIKQIYKLKICITEIRKMEKTILQILEKSHV